ncbi:general substrate transporter [Exophiala viscosa]|uniref:General substrate transporter n=1 Tax=Exophiala viscosa TaxID=2486360 RepID=A0AAN6DQU1_9EURO|nr:general substrate transporter [Exophiala viscosa]
MPSFIEKFGSLTAAGYVLTAKETSIVSSIPTVGSLIGFVMIALMADRYGRKITIYAGAVIGLVGMALQVAGSSLALVTVGRTIAATSTFVTINMALTLSAELAPACLRGSIMTLSAVTIGIAGIIASGINYGTYAILTSLAWRLPVGLQFIGPVLIILAVLFVMESPTYYLMKDDDQKARQSLVKVRQGYTNAEVDTELENMRHQRTLHTSTQRISPLDMFKGSNLRRTMLSSSFVIITQLSGLAFATSYAAIFFVEIGTVNPFLMVLALSILEWGGACVGQVLIEVLGRRNQALLATGVLFVLDIAVGGLGFAPATNLKATRAIAALCLVFGFFIAATMSPLQWCAIGEFPTARLRNLTSAYALLNSSLASLVISYVLPYITDADAADLGPKVYLIFAGCMLVCFVWAFFCYPEIRGRTLAELDEMFGEGVPARNFRTHVCVNTLENTATIMVNDIKQEHQGETQQVEVVGDSAGATGRGQDVEMVRVGEKAGEKI